MSCGNPHETDCADVLDRLYAYLDGELDESLCGDIRKHLDECGPCLKEYGLDQMVKRRLRPGSGGPAGAGDVADRAGSAGDGRGGRIGAPDPVTARTP